MVPKTPLLFTAAAALAIAIASGCNSQPSLSHSTEIRVPVPATDSQQAAQLPGLHNVVTYTDHVVCGGAPEGKEGLATLAAMGIKTIITVDGAAPDVDTAKGLGMRYIHLPISYDTVTPQRRQQLAQAIVNVDGPIYLHCHHGKHRSAAAVASALVLAGKLTPDAALERMTVSGTAKEYGGLWQAVRDCQPLSQEQLAADPASFPSISKVTGLVATMAEIDAVIDLVKQAQKAGWKAPSEHPDLVATKETQRLAELFASLQQDPQSLAHPADYQTKLGKAIGASQALDTAVRAGDTTTAEAQLTVLTKSCKECHPIYRDK